MFPQPLPNTRAHAHGTHCGIPFGFENRSSSLLSDGTGSRLIPGAARVPAPGQVERQAGALQRPGAGGAGGSGSCPSRHTLPALR